MNVCHKYGERGRDRGMAHNETISIFKFIDKGFILKWENKIKYLIVKYFNKSKI